jgi:hypothetical protein
MGRWMGLEGGTGCTGVDGEGEGKPGGDGGKAIGEAAGVCIAGGERKFDVGVVEVVAGRWPSVGVRQPTVAMFPAAAGIGLALMLLAPVG